MFKIWCCGTRGKEKIEKDIDLPQEAKLGVSVLKSRTIGGAVVVEQKEKEVFQRGIRRSKTSLNVKHKHPLADYVYPRNREMKRIKEGDN